MVRRCDSTRRIDASGPGSLGERRPERSPGVRGYASAGSSYRSDGVLDTPSARRSASPQAESGSGLISVSLLTPGASQPPRPPSSSGQATRTAMTEACGWTIAGVAMSWKAVAVPDNVSP